MRSFGKWIRELKPRTCCCPSASTSAAGENRPLRRHSIVRVCGEQRGGSCRYGLSDHRPQGRRDVPTRSPLLSTITGPGQSGLVIRTSGTLVLSEIHRLVWGQKGGRAATQPGTSGAEKAFLDPPA